MKKGKRKGLAGLPYYGGKSPRGTTGPWIASLLPQGKTYVEPFAGMCGVLLCRKPAYKEYVNDADGHLVNWWRAIRDHPKEFGRLVHNTPTSEQLYYESYDALMSGELDDDPLERARAYHVCIQQCLMSGLGRRAWALNFSSNRTNRNSPTTKRRVKALADRMRRVNILNRDAVAVVKRARNYRELVLYLDPPYRSADTSVYGQSQFDADELTEAVKSCKGFVAISGYNDDWDHLGWHRYERKASLSGGGNQMAKRRQSRIEVLWTNKPAAGVPSRTLMD